MALIKFYDFSYQYPISEDFALKNVDLEIDEGEFVAVIGANGSGKTTLANAIRGFVPHFYKGITFGEASIAGKAIADYSLGELAVKVGYIFQNPFNQISYIKDTVFDEIAYGLENLGIGPDEILERTDKIIEQLGIGYLKDKNPFEISGGQQQRVALAAILVMDPDILVIDEPTSQLDPLGTEQVFQIIDLVKQKGKTVILIEHKIDLLARFADKVIVLKDGRIVRSGKTNEVLSDPTLPEVGVQPPSYARLGHKLAEYFHLDNIPITEEEAYAAIGSLLTQAEEVK